MPTKCSTTATYDVIIIGAGISGINSAYRLQCEVPNLSFVILEARDIPGGTWSFFKYPGLRSDSDLYTFGFSWEPWFKPNPIADAESIMTYLYHCIRKYKIDSKMKLQHRVEKLSWCSKEKHWTAEGKQDGRIFSYRTRFVIMGAGYYDYTQPLETSIPGIRNFEGKVIHPQFWPEKLDYSGLDIVIIGSGATAVTLLPNLAKEAAHVTQVQRSPSYIVSLSQHSKTDDFIQRWLPLYLARKLIRLKFIVMGILQYNYCQRSPNKAREGLQSAAAAQLPSNIPVAPHFTPSYNPWDQRVCACPDGDYFVPFRQGKASIETGNIATVTRDGVVMESGDEIPADIIVTATGLKIRMDGGIDLAVDGHSISLGDKYLWKDTMLQDVPNMFFIMGSINASWTLGADANARLATRVIKRVNSRKAGKAVPRLTERQVHSMNDNDTGLIPLTSTYVKSAKDKGTLPKVGNYGNWKSQSNYYWSLYEAIFGNVRDGLEIT